RTLAASGLPASALELEITETVFQTGSATIDSLRQLRALGVTIALDDFGIGYSSLTSLEQLPISRVKLDRLLVAGVDTNPRSAARHRKPAYPKPAAPLTAPGPSLTEVRAREKRAARRHADIGLIGEESVDAAAQVGDDLRREIAPVGRLRPAA